MRELAGSISLGTPGSAPGSDRENSKSVMAVAIATWQEIGVDSEPIKKSRTAEVAHLAHSLPVGA